MNDGMLHSAAALDLLTKVQDLRAQNLANANTVGYRKRVAAAEAFASALRKASRMTLPGFTETVDQSQGQIVPAGDSLSLAIEGKGFFVLETEAGPRYTRNGDFRLDAEGFLVSHDGAKVLAESGPIQVDPGRGPVVVDDAGQVTQEGEVLGRLDLASFEDEGRLVPESDGRFAAPRGMAPDRAEDAVVHQNSLEQSNVDVVDELVQMISGFRSFQAAQKSITGIDRVRTEAMNNRR